MYVRPATCPLDRFFTTNREHGGTGLGPALYRRSSRARPAVSADACGCGLERRPDTGAQIPVGRAELTGLLGLRIVHRDPGSNRSLGQPRRDRQRDATSPASIPGPLLRSMPTSRLLAASRMLRAKASRWSGGIAASSATICCGVSLPWISRTIDSSSSSPPRRRWRARRPGPRRCFGAAAARGGRRSKSRTVSSRSGRRRGHERATSKPAREHRAAGE